MVRINRNALPRKEQEALLNQFDTLLGKLNKTSTKIFLNEILGREERITFAKRFAAIILLVEGYSEYKTARVLKLSPTSTGKIASAIALGSYTATIAFLQKNKKDYLSILKTIDSILLLGGLLPRRVGLDRYRTIYKR